MTNSYFSEFLFVILAVFIGCSHAISPQHMAVLGDSLSVGFDCQGSTVQPNLPDNWAT